MKERLDVLLVKRNLAESREKAKAVIMSGNVYVDGQKEDKAGSMFDGDSERSRCAEHTLKYVSRGGLKLEKAMSAFRRDVRGKDLYGRGCFHRRIYGLHASERGSEGLFCGCGTWTAGRGSSETMSAWSAWKRPISAM